MLQEIIYPDDLNPSARPGSASGPLRFLTKQYYGGNTMTGYVGSIEKAALKNKNFRKVLFTGRRSQLVVMSLQPREEIGEEVHKNVDQFFRIEAGKAKFIFKGKEKHLVGDGDAVVVPAGTRHNVINASAT